MLRREMLLCRIAAGRGPGLVAVLCLMLLVAPIASARPLPVWPAPNPAPMLEPEDDEPKPDEPEPDEPKPDEPQPDEGPEDDTDGDAAGEGDAGQSAAGDAPDETADEDEDAEDGDRYLVFTNAEIHTVSGGVITNGTIVCKNNVIHALGRSVEIPENAEVIDVAGHRVYPGLVAAQSTGILGGGNLSDSTDVYSLAMNLALAGGITTSVAGNDAGKMAWGSVEDLALKDDLFFQIRYRTSSPRTRRDLRDGLEEARQYLRDLEAFQRAKRLDPDTEMEPPDDAPTKGRAGEYLKLIKGERVAITSADEAQDLIELAQLAEEFGFELVIRGANEGWTVAPQLARANVSVVVTPRDRVRADEELNRPTGSSIENAAILRRHGIPLAIVPQQTAITLWGLGGQDLQHLPLEAAFAVRGGLSQRDAIRAITLDAARILGLDHRIGSIEVGKDADLIVTDGDLLHYLTHVTHAVVNGRLVYEKSEDSLFNHIRPAGDADAPPPDDHWPRRLGDEW